MNETMIVKFVSNDCNFSMSETTSKVRSCIFNRSIQLVSDISVTIIESNHMLHGYPFSSVINTEMFNVSIVYYDYMFTND